MERQARDIKCLTEIIRKQDEKIDKLVGMQEAMFKEIKYMRN